jgi:hypothetical protein
LSSHCAIQVQIKDKHNNNSISIWKMSCFVCVFVLYARRKRKKRLFSCIFKILFSFLFRLFYFVSYLLFDWEPSGSEHACLPTLSENIVDSKTDWGSRLWFYPWGQERLSPPPAKKTSEEEDEEGVLKERNGCRGEKWRLAESTPGQKDI